MLPAAHEHVCLSPLQIRKQKRMYNYNRNIESRWQLQCFHRSPGFRHENKL